MFARLRKHKLNCLLGSPIPLERVLVTGASGFIGSFVTKQLLRRGIYTAVLQRDETVGARLSDIKDQLTIIKHDTRNSASFHEALTAFKPQTVIHLGWAGVGNFDRNSLRTQISNLEFAHELIEATRAAGAQHWIGAGSQAEYGPKNHAISEKDPTDPTTLYGASKLAAYHLTKTHCSLLGLRHSWLRIFSTYGPGDNEHWMIPSLIKQLLQGHEPSLTAGEQLWDYLHVEDAACAFIAVAEGQVEGVFNLGSGEAHSLRHTIEQIRDLINPNAKLGFGKLPYRPDQVMRLQADVRLLTKAAVWKPLITIKEGLRDTVEWFSKQYVNQPTKP
jgi:nucleoside-diphosphate-sugar epimerase